MLIFTLGAFASMAAPKKTPTTQEESSPEVLEFLLFNSSGGIDRAEFEKLPDRISSKIFTEEGMTWSKYDLSSVMNLLDQPIELLEVLWTLSEESIVSGIILQTPRPEYPAVTIIAEGKSGRHYLYEMVMLKDGYMQVMEIGFSVKPSGISCAANLMTTPPSKRLH